MAAVDPTESWNNVYLVLAPGVGRQRETASASARPRTCPALINLSLAAGRDRTNYSIEKKKVKVIVIGLETSLVLVYCWCRGVMRCWNSGMHPGARARAVPVPTTAGGRRCVRSACVLCRNE